MIHRLPAIGISAFSAIIVAAPIAMLLNAVTLRVDESTPSAPIQQLTEPLKTAVQPESAAAAAPTDDGGNPVVPEEPVVEKAE